MAKLQCEVCGSELQKQDENFICQSCGCKYSLDEVKKIMTDGVVEVQGSVKVDESDKVQTYINMSTSAFEAKNGKSAFEYANKALEISITNSKAWIAKMKSIALIARLGDLMLHEVVEAGKNAILNAAESEKEDVEKTVYKYYLSRALEMLKIATTKMLDVEDLKKSYNMFRFSNLLTATKNCMEADRNLVKLYDGIADQSIALTTYVPNESLVAYPELAKLLKECAKQYKYVTDALIARYKVCGAVLVDDHIDLRNNNMKVVYNRAVDALKKIDASYVDDELNSFIVEKNKSGCYVATCVYGSYDCPEVWTLRRYRDNTLGSTWYGRAFIRVYYAVSPTLVKWFGDTKWFKKLWKGRLDKMVQRLKSSGVEDTPYQDKSWKK